MNISNLKFKIIMFLRGEFNSVRYRFLVFPREKIHYYWSRITGKSWINFYAKRLDDIVESNDYQITNPNYIEAKNRVIPFLKKKGIKPDSDFLDFGCGFLRLGMLLIPYLNKGKYTGVDISSNRIKVGIKLLEDQGIKKSDYNSIVNDTNDDLDKLLKSKYDFIYLGSVVTHMPVNDLRKLLSSFSKILKKNGTVFFTFYEGDIYKNFRSIKDFMYPFSLIKKHASIQGFDALIDDDWADKKFPHDKMAKLTLKK